MSVVSEEPGFVDAAPRPMVDGADITPLLRSRCPFGRPTHGYGLGIEQQEDYLWCWIGRHSKFCVLGLTDKVLRDNKSLRA